jgi:hypothetical protein
MTLMTYSCVVSHAYQLPHGLEYATTRLIIVTKQDFFLSFMNSSLLILFMPVVAFFFLSAFDFFLLDLLC